MYKHQEGVSIMFRSPWLRYVRLIVAAGVLFGVAYVVSKRATFSQIAYASIQVAPFTMEQLTTNFARSSEGVVIESRVTARSSDGSEAIAGTQLERPELGVLRKVILADGRAMTLVDRLSAKMSGFLSSKARAARNTRLTAPPPDCLFGAGSVVGKTILMGQEAMMIADQGPSRVTTSWRLPKYGCETVQMKIENRDANTGATSKYLEVKLVYFVAGEPDSKMFAAASTHQEMKPSEVLARGEAEVAQRDCPTCTKPSQAETEAAVKRADAKYLEAQADGR